MPTKPEKLTTLKAKLWKLTSEYVRKSNLVDGYIYCVTCGVPKPYNEIHAGHFLPKKKGSAIYFDLRDIHPQCVSCNKWKGGNIHAYYDYMLREYGIEVINELKELAKQTLHITRSEYHERIEAMKQKIAEL